MNEIDKIQSPVKSYSEYRLDEMSRRLQQTQKSAEHNPSSPEVKPQFSDEIRKLFPGIDEGKIPSSSFLLDKMPDPATLKGEHKRLWDTAVEFQSLFINMMLKGMRSTLHPENDLLHGGKTQEIFEDMLYDERAKSFSRHGGFPLSEQIYLQMAPMIPQGAESYEENLSKLPPGVSTDQIHREWKR